MEFQTVQEAMNMGKDPENVIPTSSEKKKGLFTKIFKKEKEEEIDLFGQDVSVEKEGGDLELSLEEDEHINITSPKSE